MLMLLFLRIGWVAFLRVPGQRQAVLYGSYTIPDTIIQEWIERRNQVGMVELFGAVAALETLAPRIKNTNVLLLVDAEAAQGALVKGYSPLDDYGDLLAVFWEVALEHELSKNVDRVPTDANIADAPSRARFDGLEQRGAEWVTTSPSTRLSSRTAFWSSISATTSPSTSS